MKSTTTLRNYWKTMKIWTSCQYKPTCGIPSTRPAGLPYIDSCHNNDSRKHSERSDFLNDAVEDFGVHVTKRHP